MMRVFYQSPVHWNWIRQRPHEIAEGLARCGHRVFWFYAGSFLKIRFKHFDNGNGLVGLELPVLPFASRFPPVAWLNRVWISWWLRRYAPDVVVATNPPIFQWLPKRFRGIPVVYDCMDVQAAFFTGLLRRVTVVAERKLVHQTSRIVASSSVIRDGLARDYAIDSSLIGVIPNGVVDMTTARVTHGRDSIRHCAIAYYGTIGRWFDWNAVLAAARCHPEWTFELFGPVDAVIPSLPENVCLRGVLAHDLMMQSAATAAVLLLPFVRNELTDGVDPVKMYEYLATGRPIVSSWWPLLEKFAKFPAVIFYGNEVSLSQAVESALNDEMSSYDPPYDFLSANSWPVRVKDFESVLQSVVPQPPPLGAEPFKCLSCADSVSCPSEAESVYITHL